MTRVPALVALTLALLAAGASAADSAAALYRRHAALEQALSAKAAERLAGRVDDAAQRAHAVQTRLAQESAVVELKTLALAGDVDAAHYLGVIAWDAGDLLAASLGAPPADERARLQARVDTLYREAMAWFEQAARAGHAGAAWNLARMNELGKGLPPSRGAAAPWYYEAGMAYLARGERGRAEDALKALEGVASAGELAAALRRRLAGAP